MSKQWFGIFIDKNDNQEGFGIGSNPILSSLKEARD